MTATIIPFVPRPRFNSPSCEACGKPTTHSETYFSVFRNKMVTAHRCLDWPWCGCRIPKIVEEEK